MEYVRRLSEEVFDAMAEVDLLASDSVKESADDVASAVVDLVEHATALYTRRRVGPWKLPSGPEYQQLRTRLAVKRRAFSVAVHEELDIPVRR